MSKCAEIVRCIAFFLFTVAALSACEEKIRLRFQVVTPDGFDWTQNIARVVVSAGDYTQVVECKDGNCPFSVKFSFSEGDFLRLSIHGYDAANQLVAAGYSPRFYATGQAMNLAVFFSRIDTGAVADAHFEAAPAGIAAVPYLTAVSEDLAANAGTLLFGGTRDATPVDEVWFYDPFLLALIPLEPLFIPLSESSVMDLKDGNYLIYGGRSTGGQLSKNLLFYSTTSLQAPGSHVVTLPPESSPPPMAGARVVEVGPFDRLYDNASGRYLLDAFLLLGGSTEEGVQSPAWWFAVYYDAARGVTAIEAHASDVSVPAGASAASARISDTEVRIAIPDAGAFLSARVDTTPAGIAFSLASHTIDGLPMVSGWRLVPWGDRILGLAGRTQVTQECDARWFEFAPEDFSVRELTAPAGNCESALVRMGNVVLEVGGVNAGGNPHPASYRPVRADENGLHLGDAIAVSMQEHRVLPFVFVLPTGAVAVFGGQDPLAGGPVEELEIIVPDPRKTGEPK